MAGEHKTRSEGYVAVHDVPSMRDLAFSMLSLLIEAAATHMRVDTPVAAEEKPASTAGPPNLSEARAVIDAANALLGSVRTVMENDALLAIEGMLTQLQFQYVRLVSVTRD
jgi:hypothetical protein